MIPYVLLYLPSGQGGAVSADGFPWVGLGFRV